MRWCEGRSGKEDRTPLDLLVLVTVEEAWATSNSYQVQTGHRYRKREKRMLIGILIRSVTSKRSCALDGSPSCERVKTGDESEGEKHLKL